MSKSPEAFRTISEAAEQLDLPQHVLRFWETRFNQVKPMKRGGGRRYYRPADIELLMGIRRLLYDNGYTIRGVQRILREEGVGHVTAIGRGDVVAGPHEPAAEPAPAGEAAQVRHDVAHTIALDEAQTRELRLAIEELTAAKRLLGAAG